MAGDRLPGPVASPSPDTNGTDVICPSNKDEPTVDGDNDLADTATSGPSEPKQLSEISLTEDLQNPRNTKGGEPPEWVDWRENSGPTESTDLALDTPDPSHVAGPSSLPNGELQVADNADTKTDDAPVSSTTSANNDKSDAEGSPPDLAHPAPNSGTPTPETVEGNPRSENSDAVPA